MWGVVLETDRLYMCVCVLLPEPAAPENVMVTPTGTDSLLVSWDTVGHVTGYRVTVDDDNANVDVYIDNNTASISKLSIPGREYSIAVISEAGEHDSDPYITQGYTCKLTAFAYYP